MSKPPALILRLIQGFYRLMESFYVDNIISMEVPTDSTLVDDNTGEVYEIDVEKHTLIYVKSFKKSGNYEYVIPLTLKEMILLVNSDAEYHS